MSRITTHVLDTARGRPASGVRVILEIQGVQNEWRELHRGETDADGRIVNLLPDRVALEHGIYRLRFMTGEYFLAQAMPLFYPEVDVVVALDGNQDHYHLPLLLGSFGYTTYRGS